MSEWFASGMRRDVCVLLYGESMKKQALKTALQRRYDRRLRPQQFDGAVRALVESGHVARERDGIADVLSLTERGEAGVEAQYEWLTEQVGGVTGSEGGRGTE
jgi:hypothetical protein